MVIWATDHLAKSHFFNMTFGQLVIWATGHLAKWSFGQAVIWPTGDLTN